MEGIHESWSVCRKTLWIWICAVFAIVLVPVRADSRRPFTVTEEIGLRNFGQWYVDSAPIQISPNGRLVAVWAERGLLNANRVEDEVRVYSIDSLRKASQRRDRGESPMPVIDLREATYEEGPIISGMHWLHDSSGVAFLLRSVKGNYQLATVGVREKQLHVLSLAGQDVEGFDVRSASKYAYAELSLANDESPQWTEGRVAWDATGRPLVGILLPREWRDKLILSGPAGVPTRTSLWVGTGGRPRPILLKDGSPLVTYSTALALSPDGNWIATAIPVSRVPDYWIREYRPPKNSVFRMHAGQQDLKADMNVNLTSEYALVNVRTGSVSAVNDAPTGLGVGWFQTGEPVWSADSGALLLPDAYLQPAGTNESVTRPCVAIFLASTRTMECLKPLKSLTGPGGSPEMGFFLVNELRFGEDDSRSVVLRYSEWNDRKHDQGYVPEEHIETFRRTPQGAWRRGDAIASGEVKRAVQVFIKQGLNEPPLVVAQDRHAGTENVVWNPNPQLDRIAVGRVSVYHWKDRTGRSWVGGLYKPSDYRPGRRYPLVIQTHGFPQDRFSSSGIYPTGFAARALAASEILVLQVPLCPSIDTPVSGPCEVAGYDAAVEKLAGEGLVDRNRVGISGFSYTVYTALEALTTGKTEYAAALVSNGWNYGYWEYLTQVDADSDAYSQESDAMMAARPFGAGLNVWLKRAPDFNLTKVHAPLLVNSSGRTDLLGSMWEPYAVLRYLDKPVDLVILNSDEHVLTNPAARLASQGGSVDWFRFWLQGYESPDPVKSKQYRLWEKLCELQRTENPNRPISCKSTMPRGRMERASK